MKDSVGKWFKDGAKDLNVIPPYEAWEKVEKTIEDWPKHWYQSNFAGLQHEADVASWNKLSQHLEIRRNQKIGYRNFIVRTASIAAAIILLPLWLMNVSPTNTNVNSPQRNADESAAVNAIATNIETNALPAQNQSVTNLKSTLNLNQTTAPITLIAANQATSSSNNEFFGVPNSNEPTIIENTTMKSRQLDLTNPAETSILTLAATSLSNSVNRLNEPKETNEPSPTKWNIGQTAIFGSSALLNPLSYRDDVTTASSFNISYGLSISRRFNENQFTGDLLFNDVKSQQVSLITEELNTQLNGITLALQYERIVPIFSNAERLEPELNFGVGVFGSYISNASVMSNSNESHFSSFTYRTTDFGGVISMGASVKVAKKLRFNAGGIVRAGAVNLFEGKDKIPSKLFRTQSMTMGIQAKISYTL